MAEPVPEDITKHQYGEDFQNATALNLGEVLTELKRQAATDAEKGEGNTSKTIVFQKCLDYVQNFSSIGMANEATLQTIKQLLSKPEYSLTEFEKAALVNLLPTGVEEAKILIPSLMEERPRLAGGAGEEELMAGEMMVPDDTALEGLLKDLDIHINA